MWKHYILKKDEFNKISLMVNLLQNLMICNSHYNICMLGTNFFPFLYFYPRSALMVRRSCFLGIMNPVKFLGKRIHNVFKVLKQKIHISWLKRECKKNLSTTKISEI